MPATAMQGSLQIHLPHSLAPGSTSNVIVRQFTPLYRNKEVMSEADSEAVLINAHSQKASPAAVRCTFVHAATPLVVARQVRPPAHKMTREQVPPECRGNCADGSGSPKASLDSPQDTKQAKPHVVTRQRTPLSYRVKDLALESDTEGRGRDVTTKQAPRRPSPSPIVISRSLDRERHGGMSPAIASESYDREQRHQKYDSEQNGGLEFARSLAAHDYATYRRVCLNDEGLGNWCKVAPRGNSRSPTPHGTPRPITRVWSLECERFVPADALSSLDVRVPSPVVSPTKACRLVSRAQRSCSPTPKGTPMMLSRNADRERRGGTPVTIWRGLDRERQQGAPVTTEPNSAASTLMRAGPWCHGSLTSRAGSFCLDHPPVVSPPPNVARSCYLRSSEHRRDSAEPSTAAAQCSSNRKQQSNVVDTREATDGRCRSNSRDVQIFCESLVQASPGHQSPEQAQPLSATMRKTLTPNRCRRAALGPAAPFSSRSTLPANFRPSAAMPGCASAIKVISPQAFCCSPCPQMSASRVMSPGVSPRSGSRPSSISSPSLPYSPCHPLTCRTDIQPRQLALGTGAPPPPVMAPVNTKFRRSPGSQPPL